MRKSGIDKMALLVVLGAAALVVAAATGTAPAYSDDAGTDPVASHHPAPASSDFEVTVDPGSAPPAAPSIAAPSAESDDTEGYQWSGSRPSDERYVWSHRPN